MKKIYLFDTERQKIEILNENRIKIDSDYFPKNRVGFPRPKLPMFRPPPNCGLK